MLLKKEQLVHNMPVRCIINYMNKTIIEDARISIDNDGIYICQNVINGYRCKNKLGYPCSWRYYGFREKEYDKSVIMLESKIKRVIEDGLSQGDIIHNKIGAERKVLGICGEVIFISMVNDFNKAMGICTLQQLIDFKWKLGRFKE